MTFTFFTTSFYYYLPLNAVSLQFSNDLDALGLSQPAAAGQLDLLLVPKTGNGSNDRDSLKRLVVLLVGRDSFSHKTSSVVRGNDDRDCCSVLLLEACVALVWPPPER